jgi:hypothetical protein
VIEHVSSTLETDSKFLISSFSDSGVLTSFTSFTDVVLIARDMTGDLTTD